MTKRKEICVFHTQSSHAESHVNGVIGASSGVSLPLDLPTWDEDVLESPTQWILQKGSD